MIINGKYVEYSVIVYTRYRGPTNSSGSRIIAGVQGKRGKVSIPYGDPATGSEAHYAAARAMIQKFSARPVSDWNLISYSDAHFAGGHAFVFQLSDA
jgi:hypothetical protein